MAWFSKKKTTDGSGPAETTAYQVQPDKARQWFDRGKLAADTQSYDYAITCYLTGVKFDPTAMSAHENLLQAAYMFRSTGGRPATGKEIREMLGDKRPVDKLAGTELAWVKDAMDPNLAMKLMQQAAGLDLHELAYWVGERGVNALSKHNKPTKAMWMGFLDILEEIGAWELAVKVGEVVLALDRTDANLVTRIRDLSAQATMDRGRYDQQIGEGGSFRNSIRDLDAQRELIDGDTLSTTGAVAERKLQRAKADWEKDPTDQTLISRYGELLRSMGTDEDDKEAIRVLLRGHKDTGQYRFRMHAGDVKLAMERRKLRAMRDRVAESGDDADAEKIGQAERILLEHEVNEYRDRVEKYPTDLRLKFELGSKLFEQGANDEAIGVLQDAQNDLKYRAPAMHLIGMCFFRQNWHEEAVESLRTAVETYELKDDNTHLQMRYDLMSALEQHAREDNDLALAEEAGKLASGIAMRQLSFRDIRQRRDDLRQLIKSLKGR